MRRTVLAVLVLILPCVAMGQDAAKPKPPPSPVGTLLLDSLPAQADIVVATPNLPALLAALSAAGLGDAAAWKDAFDAQLRSWGAGTPSSERLVEGGRALLAAADGEVVLASIALKLPDPSAPSVRATLFAMRSTRDDKALGAAFKDLVDGGLRLRYDGIARSEEIGGRPVLALPGSTGTLYVTVQDGLVVAADHPLALGLFFRGLAREDVPVPENRPPAAQLKLAVRHGRDKAAWEGWIWGDAESVTWATTDTAALVPVDGSYIVVVPQRRAADAPLLPAPVGAGQWEKLGAHGAVAIGLGPDGVPCVFAPETPPGGGGVEACGGAARLAWLGAMLRGKLDLPFPGMDAASLRGPFESASKSAGEKAGEFVAWKASKDPGHISGPIGHGPATFLALRCLHDISRGIAPGAGVVAAPTRKPRVDAPLPEPTEPAHK